MLFNSIDFAVFLPLVFILYWFVTIKNLKLQNLFIVVASYVFYGWWDWRFLSLIFFSSIVDYFVGLSLSKQEQSKRRKLLLWISIIVNLGLLAVFKYYNFFVDNLVHAFTLFGKELQVNSLNIILPVGISFYTFQTLSYTIDVYKRKLEPTKDVISFLAFVSFFPQLVAGPIERASNLLPQFFKKRVFDYTKAIDGLRQILWGLFKKIVIADTIGVYVDEIFAQPESFTGSSLFVGASLFIIQIYCDFSGYSDIAIGTARLFGFNLSQNFAFPLFSRSIQELWNRWHISLSSWFRDYVFFPLGGSRKGKKRTILNLLIVFMLVGLWHGADWSFVIFGVLNAIFLIPPLFVPYKKTKIVAKGKLFPTLKELGLMLGTFLLFAFSGIFFRAPNINVSWDYVKGIFSKSIFTFPQITMQSSEYVTKPFILMILIIVFLMIEWVGREKKYAIESIGLQWKKPIRLAFYYSLILMIFWFGGDEQQFIYFQF